MKPLTEVIDNLIYQTYKNTKGQPSILELEKMKEQGRQIAKDLDEYVEGKTIQVMGKLQEKLVNAFNAIEKDLEGIKQEIGVENEQINKKFINLDHLIDRFQKDTTREIEKIETLVGRTKL